MELPGDGKHFVMCFPSSSSVTSKEGRWGTHCNPVPRCAAVPVTYLVLSGKMPVVTTLLPLSG